MKTRKVGNLEVSALGLDCISMSAAPAPPVLGPRLPQLQIGVFTDTAVVVIY